MSPEVSQQKPDVASRFQLNPNSEVEFLRWRSAAVPAAAMREV
jgi:hypothetical protein